MGITLLGVLLSIGVSLFFGLPGAWWLRALVTAVAIVGLVVAVKLSTNAGAEGPLARAADWITGQRAGRDDSS